MARLFNVKHAYGKEHFKDQLPDRLFAPLKNGAQKGKKIDKNIFKKALKTYYQIRGWTKNGKPTYGKFVELGIEDLFFDF